MQTRSVKRIDRDRVELDSAEMEQALKSPCRSGKPFRFKTQVCSIEHNEGATVWERHGKEGWKQMKRKKLEEKLNPQEDDNDDKFKVRVKTEKARVSNDTYHSLLHHVLQV